MTDISQASTPSPLGNEASVRNPDGTIKDPAATATTPSGDQKTPALLNGDKSAEPKPAEGEKPAEKVIPEKYDFKLPDGMKLDEKVSTELQTKFKEIGLTQEQAQGLIDMHAKNLTEAAEAPYKAYDTMRKGWVDAVLADTDLSANGAMKPEVKASIGRMYDSLGNPKLVGEFKEAMDMTGVGDNPAFVKMLFNLSKHFAEGQPINNDIKPSPAGQTPPGAAAQKSVAQAMYPHLPSAS